ncbi:MAG: Adenine specific DNA methylase (Mod-related) [Nitrospira sp.]|jgi:adenine-specific DNA-methyltransferase|nr:Adenine specific DNA methylase (Mod-related) [Nitrospira sp.]
MAKKQGTTKTVEALKHDQAKRKNIPTAEYQSVLQKEEQKPVRVAYERRNRDLDPQLVWRGKDEQDWSDLVVHAPPLYIQEKVHPKALIDDLLRETKEREHEAGLLTPDLFADFNGIPKGVDKTEFYQHDQNWSNRMILGDSLQVMASLAEREGLRGKVQCIYFDPPYGIKFNSNFQWSTTSRDVKDGNAGHITREPEQVKAFRDTWRDGIHSYLTYLRDRLTVARDLLTDSGSIFVQIGDENVHRVRAVMEEVFGEQNVVSQIAFRTTTGRANELLAASSNYLIWATRDASKCKYRPHFQDKSAGASTDQVYSLVRDSSGVSWRVTKGQKADASILPAGARIFRPDNLTSSRPAGEADVRKFIFRDQVYTPGKGTFKTEETGLTRLGKADRLWPTSQGTVQYVRFLDDFPVIPFSNVWTDTGTGSFTEEKVYVVQTNTKVVERCLLMTTDPGDLVLDPTCGSGTTATVAEQWGRRWITIDTSRVALALARARIMAARYPFYLLADSREGQMKEAEVTRTAPSSQPVRGNIRHGFVYERVPHITLKSIANNAEIDVIWERWQATLDPLREKLNASVKKQWQEWEIPREADAKWPDGAKKIHADWWQARIARQQEIDKSIAAKAEFEYLYDKPYENKKTVRVAGPFTVESLSPHRVLGVDENDELIDTSKESSPEYGVKQTFAQMILDNLKTSGVQQAHKADKITFTALTPWPGDLVCAEGRYLEGEKEKRAAIFIGPEFGTVTRPDLVEAAREAGDAGFDVLIACAFNYDAHSTEFNKLGRIPVLKARMNADLHMADDLKNTGKGNLFVIFGEPDIDILKEKDGKLRVKVKGVDVFKPQTGEVISDGAEGIACWFIDTDYNEESFFVRQAYFLGANDPYSSLKTTLKAEIDPEAWATLNSDTSRAFDKPKSGRIAVKVINHLGDEVMKVFKAG